MLYRTIYKFLSFLLLILPLGVFAQVAEDRVAFIIGNGGYPKSLALKNPLNDATAIEKQLSSLGFETKSYKDLKVAEVSGLRQQMESRIKRNTVLFFYYAGHGVQIDGRNCPSSNGFLQISNLFQSKQNKIHCLELWLFAGIALICSFQNLF